MNRKKVKIISSVIAIVLALSMVISLLISAFYMVGASTTDEINKLKEELASIEAEKEAVQATLAQLDSEIDAAYEIKATIDRNVSAIYQEIDIAEQIVEKLKTQIEQTEEELAIAETQLDEEFELFQTRVRVMYELGETSYLDILLASGDFSDLLVRAERVNQISEYNQQVLDDFADIITQIETKKLELEQAYSDQSDYLAQLDTSRKNLETELEKSNAIIKQLEAQEDKYIEEEKKFEAYEEELQNDILSLSSQLSSSGGDYVGGMFTWPTPGHTRLTSGFGMRFHPILKYDKLHTGQDIGAPTGATIVAMNSGTVVRSTYSNGYGNYVMIDHGGGIVTLYAHMSQRMVSNGEYVQKGEQIGTVGNTGWSTGAHLHFEVIVNGKYVDPMNYFN